MRVSVKTILVMLAILAIPPSEHAQADWPIIDSISPTSGPAGVPVTIKGQHFGIAQSTGSVIVGGVPARLTSWSDTQIVVIVPGDADTGLVQIALDSGTKTHAQYPVFTGVRDDV